MGYTGAFVFGDSLVDSGNALKLANWYGDLTFSDLPDGAPTADQGYFKGRFSNGYTFADLVANKAIGLVTKPVFPFGFEDPWLGVPVAPFASDPSGINLNFAYGGAQIRQGGEAVPDLDGQTDAYRDAVDGNADPNALHLITIGGNDVRALAKSGSAPVAPDLAHAKLDAAADKLYTELSQLIAIGARHILITGIPDVGLIPQYDVDGNLRLDATELQRSEAATAYSIYLDTLIRTEVVPALQALGATVTYVPLMDYKDASGAIVTGAINANLATIAALNGLTLQELSQNLLQHQQLLFFDEVHPNAQANALLGAYMYARLSGTPWIETLPLTSADVDYRMNATIAAVGEVDKLVVSLVAGTTYTIDMLGISSLATAGSLADPSLRLLAPGGSVFRSSADEGVGFDATITFTAATSGSYTIEMTATGAPTGAYVLQAAVVGGTAMVSGNTYVIDNASTVVLEGAGGIGQDVVKASVSYALSVGSEIEILRTTNDKGKTAINLTGNEFGQTIVGNSAVNVIEGKAGADVLVGGAGNDIFVLSNSAVTSPGSANIDKISDYASGDIVDITQILNVAAGVNVIASGYVRVTTAGLVQVDLNGGANNWVTLSTVNGTGAVAVRYLAGGVVTNVSLTRVAESQLSSTSATIGTTALAGAVAASGLMAVQTAEQASATADDGRIQSGLALFASSDGPAEREHLESPGRLAQTGERGLDEEVASRALEIARTDLQAHASDPNAHLGGDATHTASQLLPGTSNPAPTDQTTSPVAESVAISSAALLKAFLTSDGADRRSDAEGEASAGQIGRILADALPRGESRGHGIDSLLEAFLGRSDPTEHGVEAAGHHAAALGAWNGGHQGPFGSASFPFLTEAFVLHHDALPLA